MNFLSGSFRIGSLFGINIRVHFLFLIWAAFYLLSEPDDLRFRGLFMAMIFGIVLVHEFGHCLGARTVGGDAENIMMWPLGGLAFAYAPMRPWPQFVTVACGPLVNLVFCLISGAYMGWEAARLGYSPWDVITINPLGIMRIPTEAGPAFTYIAIFYKVNLWLLGFNLLPIYPLDGGQLFQTLIWPFVGVRRATLLACQVGLAGAVILGVLGLREGGGGGMLFFIAIFGGFTCYQRLQALKYGMIVEEPDYGGRALRGTGPGFFERVFKLKPRRRRTPTAVRPPQTATESREWKSDESEEARLDSELDRILKKVHENGIGSLSYVEQQTLRRATQARQERERRYERQNRP